jgi:hypothetical protein
MGLTSAVNTALPLFLGDLVDQVKTDAEQHIKSADLYHTAVFYLGLMEEVLPEPRPGTVGSLLRHSYCSGAPLLTRKGREVKIIR